MFTYAASPQKNTLVDSHKKKPPPACLSVRQAYSFTRRFALQVEPEFTQQNYVKGLANLASISNDAPLDAKHLQICLKLATGLARHSHMGLGRPATVNLPDADGRLCPTEQLYYVEPEFADWLIGQELPEPMRPLHEMITPELASKLNVQSLRQIHEVTVSLPPSPDVLTDDDKYLIQLLVLP